MSQSDGKGKMKGSFQAMGLDKDLLKGLNRMGYQAPTPVQRKALPAVLAGVDTVCMARTGSGKTCVFLLPMIQKLKTHDATSGVRAIVLSPTRELAMQSYKFARDMAKFTDLRIVSIVGGDSIESQFEALATHPDVIIATPGRLMHQIREVSTFKLKNVKYLVFDEADRLFEMGFAEQLNEIVRECPAERQTLLFSATMPKQLVQFTRAGLRDPQLIRLDTDTKMSEELRLAFFSVRSNEKIAAFLYIVRRIIPADQLTIVFAATKHHSEFLHALLKKVGYSSAIVYGSMDQDSRSANLRQFRNGEVNYLIVTDVAARGIDIPLLNNVINYHFPPAAKLFVHRCGRAARQGRIGFAFSLVEPDELAYMVDVHKLLGFEVETSGPDPAVPSTALTKSDSSDGEPETGVAGGAVPYIPPYLLNTMTPQMVHTGLLPQDVLDEENEFVKQLLRDDDTMHTLWRISENGLQQYRRTRSEATRDGVKGAKHLTKHNLVREIHPLIAGEDPEHCSRAVIEKAQFVRMLQTFRPAQTVFESGIGTGTASNAIKAKDKIGSRESKGVEIMKALRLSTYNSLERNKKRMPQSTVLEDSTVAEDNDSKSDNEFDDEDNDSYGLGPDEFENTESDVNQRHTDSSKRKLGSMADETNADEYNSTSNLNEQGGIKRRLSVAEKKRLKKNGIAAGSVTLPRDCSMETDQYVTMSSSSSSSRDGGNSKMGRFRDEKYFMAYGDEDERATFSEDIMQPQSGLRATEAIGAMMMENAMLDLMPEDAIEMNKKKRMLRWDAKKRKFVKQTLEEMAASNKSKRIRTETGVIAKGSAKPQGEMYEAWKKKSRKEVSLPGTGAEVDNRPRPNVKYNSRAKDELRGAAEIRKLRATRDDNKLKNMSKDKRKKVEGKKKRAQGKYVPDKLKMNTNGPNRRVKAIIRY